MATLVAQGVAPTEVFAAVAEEIGTLLGADAAYLGRYEPDGTVTGLSAWSRIGDELPVGTRTRVVGENVTAIVRRTGRPARVNAYDEASGPIGAMLAEQGHGLVGMDDRVTALGGRLEIDSPAGGGTLIFATLPV